MGRLISTLLFTCVCGTAIAGMEDDPLLASLMVEQLEWREDDELVWDAEAWIGKDRDKLWFKSQGERSDGEGSLERTRVTTEILHSATLRSG